MKKELLENKLLAAYDYFKSINHTRNMNHIRQLAQKLASQTYGIAFAGHFSAGKSRLINAFLGDNILPSSPIPTSANLVTMYKGEDFARVFFTKGKSRKYLAPYDYELVKSYCRDGDAVNRLELSYASLHIPEGVEIMDGTFWMTDVKLRKIHLPSTLRVMEVNTFIRCPLEELELPEGIEEVPEFICEGCRELRKVMLPSTTKRIMHGAFNCCSKLSEINLPDSIELIESGVFRLCDSLKRLDLPSNIDEISEEMFYASGIESIEIHKNITGIRQWAFWGCKHLKRLVIPEWVTLIEEGIVTAHEGFEGIECHAKGYHVENDALIDDERQELLCCWTQHKHYVVPKCVRRIADISGNEFVETITVKQHVELTTYEVFASDINLKSVDFQGGVTGVTKQSFWNCPKLENK